jgi:hypothetical protein
MYTDSCLSGISTYVRPRLPAIGNFAGHLIEHGIDKDQVTFRHANLSPSPTSDRFCLCCAV